MEASKAKFEDSQRMPAQVAGGFLVFFYPRLAILLVPLFAQKFLAQNMSEIKQDGVLKALKGITTVEEIMRATRE